MDEIAELKTQMKDLILQNNELRTYVQSLKKNKITQTERLEKVEEQLSIVINDTQNVKLKFHEILHNLHLAKPKDFKSKDI